MLISHRYFWPENLSLYPAMLKDLAEWHASEGHEPIIYTAAATEVETRNQRQEWAARLGVELIEEPLDIDRGRGWFNRIGSMLRYARGLRRALERVRPDLLILGSTPPLAVVLNCHHAKRLDARVIYYVQDIVPEMTRASGGLIAGLLAGIAERIDKACVASADRVITLSKEMRETLLKRKGSLGDIRVLPNYAIEQPLHEDSPFGATPVIIFAGNLGRVQHLDHFLRAVRVANRFANFRVDILGEGSERPALERLATELELDNVRFLGQESREAAHHRILRADIGVVAAQPGLYSVAHPSKTNTYLLAGLPSLIFAEHESSIGAWLREHRLGSTASPSDPITAGRDVAELVSAVSAGRFSRHRISQTSADLLSPERYFGAYSRIIKPILKAPKDQEMNYSNDRIRYDATEFDFSSMVLNEINDRVMSEGGESLSSLSEAHTLPNIRQQLEGYRQLLFSLFRKPEFQQLYREFGKRLIDTHFSSEALIQKTPTVRIHLAGGKSVSFHSDAWYGHGQKVCSFWLPLTEVFGSNSLQMARSLDESRDFLAGIESQQLDLDEINQLAETLCDPIEAGAGDLIVFNADMVHGSIENTTGSSRVSFDFRIAESVQDIGTKPLSNFFTREQLDAPIEATAPSAATTVPHRSALMYSGLCRGISAKSQLVFLNEYARMQNIDITGSESEIVTFDYCPVLQKYAKNPDPGIDSILLFSTDLLPDCESTRRRIYRFALESGVTLVFGAEDMVLESQEDADRIERLISSNSPILEASQAA